jgi:hypothetical protein
MNGLENSLKIVFGLCVVIFACVMLIDLLISPPHADEPVETESKHGYHEISFEHENEEANPDHFQFLAYSYLPNGDITVQLQYSGKEITFDKKELEILINGKPCSCAWKVIKKNGGSLKTLMEGDTLYLTISLPEYAKRGDALTIAYEPENLVVSFIV